MSTEAAMPTTASADAMQMHLVMFHSSGIGLVCTCRANPGISGFGAIRHEAACTQRCQQGCTCSMSFSSEHAMWHTCYQAIVQLARLVE
jgi:hypothetical protein